MYHGVINIYNYLFSVEVVNNMVLNGVPFREAYKKVGIDIENGNFKAEKNRPHRDSGPGGGGSSPGLPGTGNQTVRHADGPEQNIPDGDASGRCHGYPGYHRNHPE